MEIKKHGNILISGKVDRETLLDYLCKNHGLNYKRTRKFLSEQRQAGKLDTTIQARDKVVYVYLKHREMWFSVCPIEEWNDKVDIVWKYYEVKNAWNFTKTSSQHRTH